MSFIFILVACWWLNGCLFHIKIPTSCCACFDIAQSKTGFWFFLLEEVNQELNMDFFKWVEFNTISREKISRLQTLEALAYLGSIGTWTISNIQLKLPLSLPTLLLTMHLAILVTKYAKELHDAFFIYITFLLRTTLKEYIVVKLNTNSAINGIFSRFAYNRIFIVSQGK